MSLSISMVGFDNKANLSPKEILAQMQSKRFADLGNAVETPAGKPTETSMVCFKAAGFDIIYAMMPAAIPNIEGALAQSWLFPDASEHFKRCTQHCIVTVLKENSTALERAPIITQATSALIAASGDTALGVYWGDAEMSINPKIFLEMTEKVLPGYRLGEYPIYLWVNLLIEPGQNGGSSGLTRGMAAFGHMEFEAKDTPEPIDELRERFRSLANYVLVNGPVIKDGDTIGENKTERIQVVYSQSMYGNPERVMRLNYQQPAAKKPWWKKFG
ncbi:MAG: DUF4261 domain-containing protein [Candidatus Obscuribacterales bacterium]